MATDPQDQEQMQDNPEMPPAEDEGFDAPDAGYEGEEVEDAVLNPVTRTFAVLWAPSDAMRGVKLKGGWLMPFLLLVICTAIFATVGSDAMMDLVTEQTEARMEKMVESGQVDQEQADMIMEQQLGSGLIKIFFYINPVVASLLMKLIMAALLMLAGNVFLNAKESFKRYWSLAWYAGVIGAVHLAVYGILIGMMGDAHAGYLGLAILTKADPTSTAHKLAQVVNIFLIWEAIVAGIGLSIYAKKPVGKGIMWGAIVYFAIAIISALLFGQPMV